KDLSDDFYWLIPGIFGVGGSLEVYITTPEGGAWDGFAINLLDTTDVNYNVYGGASEIVMLHMMVVRQHNELVFKTWVGGWTNILSMAIPFPEGSVTKFTIVPHADVLQVLMNDEHLVQYPHTVDPTTAKLINIGPFSNTLIKLHNITFIGI
ncbi:uncharacterized protein LOC132717524, partial [Ruditapes philippinarum]|uniref:uncharacterized protein LOC132717524 n=1 Tax=Ruditapes philippinarum TaxID=129788 RepID=UPI00295C03C2